MIIYFSGTGNSAYVAHSLGKLLDEETVRLTDRAPSEIVFSGKYLIIVYPIYSWGVPPIVLEYISRLNDGFVAKAARVKTYMICVCGDETAMAPEMLKPILGARGLNYAGGWSVQMPNNYVLLPGFNVDPVKLEKEKLKAAPERVGRIAEEIRQGAIKEDFVRGRHPKTKSRMIYPLFKRWGIVPSKWHFTEECVGCGRCEKVCPVGNIKFVGGRPKWGSDCTSCLACYHICPGHAVQYGRATRHKGQYFFKK